MRRNKNKTPLHKKAIKIYFKTKIKRTTKNIACIKMKQIQAYITVIVIKHLQDIRIIMALKKKKTKSKNNTKMRQGRIPFK
jgi:hypothetical protein